jgi:hypothetical protein
MAKLMKGRYRMRTVGMLLMACTLLPGCAARGPRCDGRLESINKAPAAREVTPHRPAAREAHLP